MSKACTSYARNAFVPDPQGPQTLSGETGVL